MTIAGDSRDRAIELARRMEESRRFAQTNIIQEHSEKTSTGDTEEFDIVAIYIPEPLAAASPKTEMKSKTDMKSKIAKPKTAIPNRSPR
jgi:hypothetical protein